MCRFPVPRWVVSFGLFILTPTPCRLRMLWRNRMNFLCARREIWSWTNSPSSPVKVVVVCLWLMKSIIWLGPSLTVISGGHWRQAGQLSLVSQLERCATGLSILTCYVLPGLYEFLLSQAQVVFVGYWDLVNASGIWERHRFEIWFPLFCQFGR